MRTELTTVFFPRKNYFNQFLKVFKKSASKCMPDTKIRIIKMKTPEKADHKKDCTYAFFRSAEHVIKNNYRVAMADVDLMFRKDIMHVFKGDFDIAITIRYGRMKYNTGLWYYKPTEKAKKFVKRWLINTRRILDNMDNCAEFIYRHGGIDQASLAVTIEEMKDIKILELPCEIYNSCQDEWQLITNKTKVIHIKSKLRLFATGKRQLTDEYMYLKPIVKEWRSYL